MFYLVSDDAGNRQGDPMQLTPSEASDLAQELPDGWNIEPDAGYDASVEAFYLEGPPTPLTPQMDARHERLRGKIW